MTVTPKLDEYYHHKLPIDDNEKILGVYKHHFIVYLIPLLMVGLVISVFGVLAYMLVALPMGGGGTIIPSEYSPMVYAFLILFSVIALLFSYIPIWIKSQERLVLTDEALLQLLQPSLFSDKVSQLSLQHVADVSVRQNFWGNMFGYGTITVETPGEQSNYTFTHMPTPGSVARAISNAHENFITALESGQLKSNYHKSQPLLRIPANEHAHGINPDDYKEFLEFKRMKEQSARPAVQTESPDKEL